MLSELSFLIRLWRMKNLAFKQLLNLQISPRRLAGRNDINI